MTPCRGAVICNGLGVEGKWRGREILGPTVRGMRNSRQPKVSDLKELCTGDTGPAILARFTERNVGLICGSGKSLGNLRN